MERSTGGGWVLRAGLQRGKYTLKRDATGCLEHHQLVAPEVLGQDRRQGRWVGRRDKAVAKGAGVRLERRNEVADGGQELGVQVHQRFGNLAMEGRPVIPKFPHGPGDKYQAPAASEGGGGGDCGPK
jgi:hypothetical protein